ncbi:MAG TPA: archease [candidate division Zixibacteria bacterium]|nr:archease [candidate division Zixibacteria bacterium]
MTRRGNTADPRVGVREIDHTADVGIEVTARDARELFREAARGLFALIADTSRVGEVEERELAAEGDGVEELLHSWLCEALALFNSERFIGKSCAIALLDDKTVAGRLRGERLDPDRHRFRTEIKGVTYHGFEVRRERGLWRARVIFDV